MHTPLVVVGSVSIQLSLQVETVPEEGLVEIFSPESSDESLDERMRARHERNRLDFLDVENAQIRSPTMKAGQRVVIGTEILGKRLSASRLVKHAANTDTVDMRRFNTESDNSTREDVHDAHHPEALLLFCFVVFLFDAFFFVSFFCFV